MGCQGLATHHAVIPRTAADPSRHTSHACPCPHSPQLVARLKQNLADAQAKVQSALTPPKARQQQEQEGQLSPASEAGPPGAGGSSGATADAEAA